MPTIGRYVFGTAALLLGAAGIALHDQLISNWQLPGDAAFLLGTSAAQVAGGVAVQIRWTERWGALTLGSVYLLCALTLTPDIVTAPSVYASWGNVFYGLASVAGAAVAYVLASPSTPRGKTIGKAAVVLLGLCCASFAVEQVEFFGRTAGLVPKWVPPNGAFWAVATTIAFGLAAVSLVSGYLSLLAARLVAAMLAGFGVLVWIPALIADPKTHSNWSEGLETFLIAGAAWIVADLLGTEKRAEFG